MPRLTSACSAGPPIRWERTWRGGAVAIGPYPRNPSLQLYELRVLSVVPMQGRFLADFRLRTPIRVAQPYAGGAVELCGKVTQGTPLTASDSAAMVLRINTFNGVPLARQFTRGPIVVDPAERRAVSGLDGFMDSIKSVGTGVLDIFRAGERAKGREEALQAQLGPLGIPWTVWLVGGGVGGYFLLRGRKKRAA